MAGEEIKVPIGIPVETNAAEAGDSIESLRDRIAGSTDSIRAMSASLKLLRGTSDEVKAAKAALTAKVNTLKDSVSASTLALVKQGSSFDAVAQKEKKALESKKKLGGAIDKVGGPVASLKGKLEGLKDIMGTVSGSGGMGALALAGASLAAVVAVVIAGITAAGVALTKFVLGAANAARDANLLREAFSGTAKNASALGTQVDALSLKVPTSKDKLNELAISLMKMRIPGGATVDAFHAIAQASAALGDQGGAKLQEFIDRAKMFSQTGRGFRLAQADFADGALGNLEFGGVATALAKNLGIGIAEAKERLRVGAVSVAQGAKAMRDAAEGAFGGINLRKMMSFDVITKKLGERFDALTSGVNLEPLLKPLSELVKLFDASTVTGATLKMLVTEFGNGMVKNLTTAIPFVKALFKGLVLGALDVGIAFHTARAALKNAFGGSDIFKDVDGLQLAFKAGTYAVIGLAAAVVTIGGVMALALTPVLAVGYAIKKLCDVVADAGKAIKGVDWVSLGVAITDGLLGGIISGGKGVIDGVHLLADDIVHAFTNKLKIHSPSKVFAVYGENIAEGAEQGIQRGSPKAQAAAAAMVTATGATAASGGMGGAPITINVTINAAGAEPGAPPITSDSFMAKLTKAVEDALITMGIPVVA